MVTVWKMVSWDPGFWNKSSHIWSGGTSGAPGGNEQDGWFPHLQTVPEHYRPEAVTISSRIPLDRFSFQLWVVFRAKPSWLTPTEPRVCGRAPLPLVPMASAPRGLPGWGWFVARMASYCCSSGGWYRFPPQGALGSIGKERGGLWKDSATCQGPQEQLGPKHLPALFSHTQATHGHLA